MSIDVCKDRENGVYKIGLSCLMSEIHYIFYYSIQWLSYIDESYDLNSQTFVIILDATETKKSILTPECKLS